MAEPAAGDQRTADPAALRDGYEHLRERVLAGQPDGWRAGLGVLVSRGVVAWIAAWAALSPAPQAGTPAPDPPSAPARPPSAPAPQPASALSSPPGAGQIVAVLAQMALAHA